jgi:hypothetical protein
MAQIQIEGDFLASSFSILEEQPMDMLLGKLAPPPPPNGYRLIMQNEGGRPGCMKSAILKEGKFMT